MQQRWDGKVRRPAETPNKKIIFPLVNFVSVGLDSLESFFPAEDINLLLLAIQSVLHDSPSLCNRDMHLSFLSNFFYLFELDPVRIRGSVRDVCKLELCSASKA